MSAETPRRRFLKALAAAPLLPAALTQTPPVSPSPSAAPAAPVPSPSASASPEAPGPVADALGEVVRARYGPHLEAGELDQVKKNIADGLRNADGLRKVPLASGDEPVTRFTARPPALRAVAAPSPPAPPSRRARPAGRTGRRS